MIVGVVHALGATLTSPVGLVVIVVGSLAGIVGGFIPGLSAPGALAILLPFTFGMDATDAIVFLVAAYTGAQYGGSITATLLNTPGAPESAVMTVDGFALTRAGQARRALHGGLIAGLVGGLVGVVLLMALIGPAGALGPKFGPPMYASLAVLGFTVTASVSAGARWRGVACVAFGVLLSTVGLDPVSGIQRFTFGLPSLYGGFQLVPVLIGLFAVSEAMVLVTRTAVKTSGAVDGGSRFGFPDAWRHRSVILMGSAVGSLVGILPGGGGALASWLGYSAAKAVSREPEAFGRGAIDGLLGPEAADKAIVGTALIPLLALGVPSTASAGVLLGGIEIHNLVPGPGFLTSSSALVYSLIAGVVLANIAVYGLGRSLIPALLHLRSIDDAALGFVILAIAVLGSYAYNAVPMSVITACSMGIVGYLLRRAGFPLAPVILGLLLGPIFETNLRLTLTASGGSLLPFATEPVSAGLLALALLVLVLPVAKTRWKGRGPTVGTS